MEDLGIAKPTKTLTLCSAIMREISLEINTPVLIQDVFDHGGDKRKVLNCGRNMHRIRTDGKSIVQLEVLILR